MKIKKKLIFTLFLLSLSFLLININIANAADDYNITIEGNANGLVTIPDKEEFLIKENMLPGDIVTGTINLDNKYDEAYVVLLRAEDFENNGDVDFVKQLKLELSIDGVVFYKGDVHGSGEEGLEAAVSLGKINPGESIKVYAKVTLDGKTTGNEFKNKYASVKWIFTAMTEAEFNVIEPPKPIIESEDEEEEPYPIISLIRELKEAVQTGDYSKGFSFIILIILSGVIIGYIFVKRRGDRFGK